MSIKAIKENISQLQARIWRNTQYLELHQKQLALIYRAYRLTTVEEVGNDPEDSRVAQLSTTDTPAVEEDRGEPSVVTDADAPAELDALPADPVEQA